MPIDSKSTNSSDSQVQELDEDRIENQDKKEPSLSQHLLVGLCAVTFILGSVYIYHHYVITSIGDYWEERGTFGDMFGGLNAIFSGLAFAAFLYTIYLQRKELNYQRQELRDNREQLSRSADAQEKSEDALQKQILSMQESTKVNALSALIQTNLELRNLTNSDFYEKSSFTYLMALEKELMKMDVNPQSKKSIDTLRRFLRSKTRKELLEYFEAQKPFGLSESVILDGAYSKFGNVFEYPELIEFYEEFSLQK